MNYYEIVFYGEGHEKDWTFYLKSETKLTDARVAEKLQHEFIGVDGLEQHHLENIVSVNEITVKEFEMCSGIETGKSFTVQFTLEVTAQDMGEAVRFAVDDVIELYKDKNLVASVTQN